jgi:CRISPR-associated protein Csd1
MIFPTILNLSRHHEKELRDEKERVWFEKLEQDIVKRISANGFPAHLDLQDQGRFFVGYYHQRQDFFEKKSDKNENE